MKKAHIWPQTRNDERKKQAERERQRAQDEQRIREELVKSKRRYRVEIMMVAATVLSAIATTATVIVGVYQYGAAKEQVAAAYQQTTAADRNRTFEDVLKQFDVVCDGLKNFAGITILIKSPSPGEDYATAYASSSKMDKIFDRRSELWELPSAIQQMRQKLRYFDVWVPDQILITEMRWMLNIFDLPIKEVLARVVPTADFRFEWQRAFVRANALCLQVPTELITYIREGYLPDLRGPEVYLYRDDEESKIFREILKNAKTLDR